MEVLDTLVEFLCLGCGLQGLSVWPDSDDDGIFCPKCGDRVITSHLLKKTHDVMLTV